MTFIVFSHHFYIHHTLLSRELLRSTEYSGCFQRPPNPREAPRPLTISSIVTSQVKGHYLTQSSPTNPEPGSALLRVSPARRSAQTRASCLPPLPRFCCAFHPRSVSLIAAAAVPKRPGGWAKTHALHLGTEIESKQCASMDHLDRGGRGNGPSPLRCAKPPA